MDNYAKELTEVYYIINKLQQDLKEKIPKDLIETIRERMDKEYIPIGNNISDIASAMLSVIYSDYICEGQEKLEWKKFDNFHTEEAHSKNFSNNQLFETNQMNIEPDDHSEICNDNKSELLVVEDRKSKLKDLLVKLKNIFRKFF